MANNLTNNKCKNHIFEVLMYDSAGKESDIINMEEFNHNEDICQDLSLSPIEQIVSDYQMEDCKCEKHCFDKISENVRKQIYNGYKSLTTSTEQYLYLYGLIWKICDKSNRPNSRFSYSYNVKIDGFQVNICQKAFMSIHDITPAKLRTVLNKINRGIFFIGDRRGKNKQRYIDETKKRMEEHILSVLCDEEVRSGMSKGRRIKINRMWEDYVELCDRERRKISKSYSICGSKDEIPVVVNGTKNNYYKIFYSHLKMNPPSE